MPRPRAFRELRLLNGSAGDPFLFVDDQGRDNALLIDCGDDAVLGDDRLADLEAVFLTHHHVDHFIGFDRVVRANLDRDKAVHFYGPAGTIGKLKPTFRRNEIGHDLRAALSV
jgi:ribonuclease Z